MNDWSSLAAIASAVSSGKSSARAEAQRALALIAARNPALNAVVTVNEARSLAEADAVDRRVAAGETLALAGVPVVIKDNIWVKGWRITQGSKLFADFHAPDHAIAVERLTAAGAVVVGIANTSEFACKGLTNNLIFGPTLHPMNPELTPGGSSGGPVVAVASGMVPLAIGTDAGGSSRRPPAHVGLVGLKGTLGAIPYGPGFPEATVETSVISPITRDVADCALVFEVLAGMDTRDPGSIAVAEAGAAPVPRDIRIAYAPTFGLDVPVDPEVRDSVADASRRLAAGGFRVERLDPVWPEGAAETGLMPIQHAALAAIHGEAWKRDPSAIDPDLGAQIAAGFAYRPEEIMRALLLSQAVGRTSAAFFSKNAVDILLGPTTACTAWPWTQLGPATINGVPVGPRGHAVFTPLFNHSRQPAITLPCGKDRKGLPIGLQMVAARGQDRRLLQIASLAERMLAT